MKNDPSIHSQFIADMYEDYLKAAQRDFCLILDGERLPVRNATFIQWLEGALETLALERRKVKVFKTSGQFDNAQTDKAMATIEKSIRIIKDYLALPAHKRYDVLPAEGGSKEIEMLKCRLQLYEDARIQNYKLHADKVISTETFSDAVDYCQEQMGILSKRLIALEEKDEMIKNKSEELLSKMTTSDVNRMMKEDFDVAKKKHKKRPKKKSKKIIRP